MTTPKSSPASPVLEGAEVSRSKGGDCATPPTFRYRDEPCSECDFGCKECEGAGEVPASCADCGDVRPLDDDGLCAFCVDASELPIAAFNAKWLCKHVLAAGAARVEA